MILLYLYNKEGYMSLLSGLSLLSKFLPVIQSVSKPIMKYIRPKDQYNKNRVIFVIIMFLILLGSVSILGEVNTTIALDSLDKLCDTVNCD
jgi:hypothetical protein